VIQVNPINCPVVLGKLEPENYGAYSIQLTLCVILGSTTLEQLDGVTLRFFGRIVEFQNVEYASPFVQVNPINCQIMLGELEPKNH
jgi:hypothetical protein